MKCPSRCPPDAPHERESLCHFLKTTEPPKHKSAISARPQAEKQSSFSALEERLIMLDLSRSILVSKVAVPFE